eukprot:5316073-Prymnesium_polylepis.1
MGPGPGAGGLWGVRVCTVMAHDTQILAQKPAARQAFAHAPAQTDARRRQADAVHAPTHYS